MNFVFKKSATRKAIVAGTGGGVAGAILGYRKGKKDGMKKKAADNRYIEKLARSIGDIGKALIRTKLAPAMANMSKGTASKLETISRASAGSKVAPRVFSTPEYAQHASAMTNLGKKLVPGMKGPEANKIFAVAARARKMGVIPGK